MATENLSYAKFILVDNWPGVPVTVSDIPTNGFTGSGHHNTSDEVFPIGTKMQVYCDGTDGTKGYATLVYLKFGAEDSSTDLAAKGIVVQDDAATWFSVTNDPAAALNVPTGLAAVAISAMAEGNYGWFWCGGVCPTQYASALAGAFLTDESVVAGPFAAGSDGGTTPVLALVPVTPTGTTTTDLAETVFGYALSSDTSGTSG